MMEISKIRKLAQKSGFLDFGITNNFDFSFEINEFLRRKKLRFFSNLPFLEKNLEVRQHPENFFLPNSRVAAVFAVSCFFPPQKISSDFAEVASFAVGLDKTKIFKKKIFQFAQNFHDQFFPQEKFRVFCDSEKILEKSLAVRAGLGTFGKNGLFYSRQKIAGSFVVIGGFFSTADLPVKNYPIQKNFPQCGDCQICQKKCPTKAIISPGILDPRKCLSFWNIEFRGEKIPKNIASKMGKKIFGCDDCQICCPRNRDCKFVKNFLTEKIIAGKKINLEKILKISDQQEFQKNFTDSSILRAKLTGIKRNAKICQENSH